MRVLFLLICVCATTVSSCLAQSGTEERSSVLYVVGRVETADDRSCAVDIGAVQTMASQDQLAVFRSVYGYFRPVGRITVARADSTTSHCVNHINAQPNDVVIAVREINELHPGDRHREKIVRRLVVRAKYQTSSSTVHNVRTAQALSDYQKLFPEWESSRGAVAGRLLSAVVRESADERLEQLTTQINLMRRLYQQSVQTVNAAGEVWADVMPVLAGSTANAGHALRVQDQQDEAGEQGTAEFAAVELRSRVFEQFFQLQREQQNVLALLIASQIATPTRNDAAHLQSTLQQTQFPDLGDDDQLMLNVGRLVTSFRDRL